MKNYVLYSFSLLLVFTTFVPLPAQQIAGVFEEASTSLYQDQHYSLQEVLTRLENQYEIIFDYDTQVIKKKKVKQGLVNKWDEKQGLEELLQDLLGPLNLTFEKYSDNSFLIHPLIKQVKPIPMKGKKLPEGTSERLELVQRLQAVTLAERFIQKTISGQVIDLATNESLPGVNILAKGTTTGTVTDVNGNYRLTVADEVTTLVFSSIGYETIEESISGRTVIDMALAPDIQSLSEVVVIGYGTKERRDLTTAISSIETEEITQTVALSPELAMQGRMTGVQVSGNNGNPFTRPTVRIRGQNTWRAADPLYVIDGVPIREPTAGTVSLDNARFEDIRGPLNIMTLIDPNDIASISVLKDASAAAIYGVAAGNGVILITTKSGARREGIQVQVGARAGIRRQNRRYDVMNSEEFARYQRLVYESDPTFELAPDHAPLIFPDSTGYLGNGPTYDWQDAVTNNEASFQDYSLILSGGSSDADYKVGFNYASNDGVGIGTNLERISGSLNVNFDITDWLRTGLNARIATADGRNRQFNATNQILGASTTNPWQPILGDGPGGFARTIVGIDASGNWDDTRLWGAGTRANAVADDFFNTTTFQTIRGLGNVYLQVEPLEGLIATGRLYVDQSSNRRFLWRDGDAQVFSITGEDPRSFGNGFSQGRYNYRNNLSTNIMRELSLNYQKSFGNHNLDLLLAVQDQRWEGEYLGVETEQTSSSDPDLRFIPATQNEFTSAESEAIVREALVGQFIRAGYDYNNTYYLDVTVRRDGSTRFAPENRFGVFPAFSAAYRITNEPFINGVTSWLNDLKIRGGWGQLGNYDVAQLAYLSPVEEKPTYSFGGSDGNGNVSTGAAVFTIPNPDLQWERTTTTNIGFDAYLLDNNLGISFDYYNKRTEDILQTVPLPSSVGVSLQPSGNIGEVVNRGIEIAANYQFSVGPVNFDVGANITTVHNEVTKLKDGIPVYGGGLTLEEGQPINFIRGYQVAGLFTDQEQVDDFLATTTDENYRSAEVAPGDLFFADVAGAPTEEGTFISPEPDGVINFFDQTFLGNTLPGYFYGFNLGVNMKGFNLSMQFTGVGDVSRYNLERRELIATGFYGDNRLREVFGAWSESNQNTSIPRIIANDPAGNNRFSSRFIESGAYLRLNYIELGYTLPNPEKIGMSRARIYVGGSNLFTVTEYTGLDPESYDSPTPITLLTGLNITF